jgi:hypothetical protein
MCLNDTYNKIHIGKHQLLVYADGVHLLGENINNIKKNAEALLDDSKEIGLEVNSEKSKYMFMSHHQTAGQSNYIRVANKSFEKVAKFKYVGAILTDQNYIHEEIKSRLNFRECLLPCNSESFVFLYAV